MKKIVIMALTACLALGATAVYASQADDITSLRNYFKKKFPKVPFDDFANGAYALDADKRINWEGIREFPPFEDQVAEGEAIWNKKFKNGNSFATCFGASMKKTCPASSTQASRDPGIRARSVSAFWGGSARPRPLSGARSVFGFSAASRDSYGP